MLGDWELTMDKKPSRQSSVPPKSGSCSDSKKNDCNSPNRFVKFNKKRDAGGAKGGSAEYARRPNPQKSRSTEDKRPRSKGYSNDRQREEVGGQVQPEYGSPLFTGGSKKGKANLNHLLNFTFAERDGHYGVGSNVTRGVSRRRCSSSDYNKERFLQANCQFVVGDAGDYSVHSLDADTLVSWELVEQVRTTSYEEPACPICLQAPQAGKITKCGHIFCSACILHYLVLGEKTWRKCPICYDAIDQKDLKSVSIRVVHDYAPGEEITLRLMKRERESMYAVPRSQWKKRDGQPHSIDDHVCTEYMKLLVASPSQILQTIIRPEQEELRVHRLNAEPSEICFIEGAEAMLKEREDKLLGGLSGEDLLFLEEAVTPDEVAPLTPESPIEEYPESIDEEDSVAEAGDAIDPPVKRRGNVKKTVFYYFQAIDGQHIYIHSINVRCLIAEYGSVENCPDIITATIVDTDITIMKEELRKRLTYMRHLPLTCEFKTVELSLQPPLVSLKTLELFAGDFANRQQMRERKVREEKRRSKKIEKEENERMGKFPGMQYSLTSPIQFPCGLSNVGVHEDFPLPSNSASSPGSEGSELAGGFARSLTFDEHIDDDNSMSFAQMLKGGHPSPRPAWPMLASSPRQRSSTQRSTDGEDSDGEVHAPVYQMSVSNAIQDALDKRSRSKGDVVLGNGSKKKKKQKFTPLFTTSTTRGGDQQ